MFFCLLYIMYLAVMLCFINVVAAPFMFVFLAAIQAIDFE